MEQQFVVLLVLVFLDMLAVGLVIPLLPFLAEQLEMGPELYGLLGTCYQAAQLIGSLFMGVLSDAIGKKGVLLLSFAGSAVSYLILGFTGSILMVFFSRLLVGAVKQTMSISTSLITEMPSTKDNNLSSRIGVMRACMSCGFIIGPLCGGALSSIDSSVPTTLSAVLFAINSAIVIIFLPNSKSKRVSFHGDKSKAKSFLRSVRGISNSIANVSTRRWLIMTAIVYFSLSMVRSNMPLSNKENFDVGAQGNGIFMASLGASSVLTQSIGVPLLSKYFGSTQLQLICGCSVLVFAFFANMFAPSFEMTIVAASFMILGNGILSTTVTARYSQALPKGNTGGGMGVSGAVTSLMGVISPTLAGVLYQQGGNMLPSLVALIITFGMLFWIIVSPPPTNRATQIDKKVF